MLGKALALLMSLTTGAAWAETVILKDGTFVEGRITLKTSRSIRIETRFGTRTFALREVDQIIEDLEASGLDASTGFEELPAPLKAVLNAQADYKLKNYQRALTRLEPFRNESNKAIRIQMDWLVIEIFERLGRWEAVHRLLKEKQERGTPRERIRAKAHLDLFKANPEYDLRYVGEKHARNFIRNDRVMLQVRERGSLQNVEVMRLALEEYCEQLLVKDELSVKAFTDRLDVDKTYAIIKELPAGARLADRLGYMEDLKKAEASVYKAQSILGDYGVAFEADLARAELAHLLSVLERVETEILELSPESFTPASEARTGRLTPQGRKAWRERCNEFLAAVRPFMALIDYMKDKAQRHPRRLLEVYKLLMDNHERYDQMIKAVKRARNRTHV